MIGVGVRNNDCFERPGFCKLRISPTEETYEVVSLPGVYENVLIVWSDDKAAVTLTNVDKDDLEQAILLNIFFADPSFLYMPRANSDPAIFSWAAHADVIAPEQLFQGSLPVFVFPAGFSEYDGRGITGKMSDWFAVLRGFC